MHRCLCCLIWTYFFALYVLVNALCAGFACAHCEDNGCSAGDCIAACENALASRCAAFVCLDAALTGEGQTLGGVADQRVGAGADGDNDSVNVEDPVRALNGNGLAATLFVRLAELLLLKLDAGDVAVLAGVDGYGLLSSLNSMPSASACSTSSLRAGSSSLPRR